MNDTEFEDCKTRLEAATVQNSALSVMESLAWWRENRLKIAVPEPIKRPVAEELPKRSWYYKCSDAPKYMQCEKCGGFHPGACEVIL